MRRTVNQIFQDTSVRVLVVAGSDVVRVLDAATEIAHRERAQAERARAGQSLREQFRFAEYSRDERSNRRTRSASTSRASALLLKSEMTNAIDTQLFEEISDERLSAAREMLTGRLRRTPIVAWPDDELGSSNGGELLLKLEVLQHAGCFKTRGALLHLLSLDSTERARGVVTASAGNHAAVVVGDALAISARWEDGHGHETYCQGDPSCREGNGHADCV